MEFISVSSSRFGFHQSQSIIRIRHVPHLKLLCGTAHLKPMLNCKLTVKLITTLCNYFRRCHVISQGIVVRQSLAMFRNVNYHSITASLHNQCSAGCIRSERIVPSTNMNQVVYKELSISFSWWPLCWKLNNTGAFYSPSLLRVGIQPQWNA